MPSFVFTADRWLYYTIIVAVFDQQNIPQEWNIDMLAPSGEQVITHAVVTHAPYPDVYASVPVRGTGTEGPTDNDGPRTRVVSKKPAGQLYRAVNTEKE